ncbi:hypothetical protein [Tateyamaria sp.]|uniref:hypothetical protein n=1 Tax=Tateyamaria sp. TaxID=1929288 RepID=UPI00329FA7F0
MRRDRVGSHQPITPAMYFLGRTRLSKRVIEQAGGAGITLVMETRNDSFDAGFHACSAQFQALLVS